jgi:hypothetical protein
LTIAQLCVELNVDDKDAAAVIAEKWRASRFAVFDKICARHKLTPAALSAQPIAQIERMIRSVLPPPKDDKPQPPIDTTQLHARLAEYLEAHP